MTAYAGNLWETARHEKTPSRKRGSIANRREIQVRSRELHKLTRKEHATDLYAAETERVRVKESNLQKGTRRGTIEKSTKACAGAD